MTRNIPTGRFPTLFQHVRPNCLYHAKASVMRVYISDLKDHVGQTVTLKGWVYNHRSSGKIKFLLLRDGTGICQCVYFRGECDEKAFEEFEKLSQESCVRVTGVVKAEPRSPGGYEIGCRE